MKTIQDITMELGQIKQFICFLLFFIVVSSNVRLQAQEANFRFNPINRTQGESLAFLLNEADSLSNDSVMVEIPDVYTHLSTPQFVDLFYFVEVKLFEERVDVSDPVLLQALRLDLIVEFEGKDENGAFYSHSETISLEISPRKDESKVAFFLSPLSVSPYDFYSLENIKVTAPKSLLATHETEKYLENIQLKVFVDRGRYYQPTNINIAPEIKVPSTDPNNELKANEALIVWDEVKKPSTYEIEWIHVPFHSTTGVSNIKYNFAKNAVRIHTNKAFVPLNLVHNNGFIVVRGRTKRPALNQEQTALTDRYVYSSWSLPDSGIIAVSNNAVVEINNSKSNSINSINWQYKGSYANEGKKKELLNLFDGSKRQRQANTYLYDNSGETSYSSSNEVKQSSTVLSTENYYDYNGQKVIQFLPAPLINSSDIGYQKRINQLNTGKLLKYQYDALGFDTTLAFTSDSAGASQYFSPQNQLLSTDFKARYIPDAGKYPYSRTEFMPDGSGRVKTEYGIGEDQATNATKGTQYAYVKAGKYELEPLFGTNIGNIAFYKKDIVIDPNGVMNMSYKDQEDRVVATSIAGIAEGRSNMNDIPFSNQSRSIDLTQSGAEQFLESEGAYELSYPIYVPVGSTYEFYYGFDLDAYEACSSSPLCYDCSYNFTFQIFDVDNNLVLETNDIIDFNSCTEQSYYFNGVIDSIHEDYSASIIGGDTLSIGLSGRKQYTIYKRLSLLTDSFPIYAQQHLESGIESGYCGFKDYEYFEQNELNQIDFYACQTDYSKEPKDICRDTYERLRDDFLFPDGYFVKHRFLNPDDFLLGIYDSLRNTFSCNRMSITGCYGSGYAFVEAIKSKFGLHFQNFDDSTANSYIYNRIFRQRYQIADYLVKLHPNYCQYQVCQQKYGTDSPFDEILEKSKNLDDFLAMGEKFKLFGDDSIIFKWDNVDSAYIGIRYDTIIDTLKTAEVLYYYDPVTRFIDSKVGDSTERYQLCGGDGTKLGWGYYSTFIFNNYVKECMPNLLDSFNRVNWYNLYFDNIVDGCYPDSIQADTPSLYNTVRAIARVEHLFEEDDTTLDHKWNMFKGLYKTIRDRMMGEMLTSFLCVQPGRYTISDDCSQKTDTSGLYPCWDYDIEKDGSLLINKDSIEWYCNACLEINLGCQEDIERYYWRTAFGRFSYFSETLDEEFDSLETYSEDTTLIHKQAGNQVYQLLKYNGCDALLDSLTFISNFDARLFVCNPFNYLSGMPGVNCNVDTINLASIQTDLLQFKRDSADLFQRPYFQCAGKVFKEAYVISEMDSVHQLVAGSYPIPSLNSEADLNINSDTQRIYAYRMNAHLGLSLGFADYYYFFKENTPDSTLSYFGDSAIWENTTRGKEIREVATENNDAVNYKELEEDSIFSLFNKHLLDKGYDTLNIQNDYLGFGETDFRNGENDLFLFENGKLEFGAILDTFNYVFEAVKDSLALLGVIESQYSVVSAQEIKFKQYKGIVPFSTDSLLFDRAVRYSNGTIWVRLLHPSDSSYYDDYYFYYQPFTYFYDYLDIDSFDSISPVFDSEEMKYAKMTFKFNHRNYHMLVSRSSGFGNAERIAKVLFSAPKGTQKFPVDKVCEDLAYERALINAHKNYNNHLEEKEGSFIANMTSYCLSNSSSKAITNRRLNMSFASGERQYTLYYYDQAGNLVMTVPPDGIDTNFLVNYDGAVSDNIAAYRNGSGASVLPNHTKRTTYKYNSDNNIIRQVTPNSDTSHFWYDKAGRLVFSQNAKQRPVNAFSYTIYDAQSRLIEVGEVTLNELSDLSWEDIHAITVLEIIDSVKVNLDSVIQSKVRNDVVRSFYDSTILDESSYGFEQKNLRSRLSTQAYYPFLDDTTTLTYRNWEFATHYSYDPTGNVKTLVNDFYQQGNMNRNFDRFKRIDYAYDVISGNVLQVYYQLGLKDAFYHRYEYDAENRITKVETSRDGIIWDEDANYEYYLHGPLARTEIGEHNVQGIDYAYTLQGWVKSVNAGHKNADMGLDHEKDNVFASDAFGFSIQYNQNDYEPIGSNNDFLIQHSGHSDLYNGNIAAISLHNQEMTYGRQYIYDQLNRLTEMNEYNVDEASKSWDGVMMNGNTSTYEYDKNGNLTELTRFDGEKERFMDVMNYHYINGTDQLSYVTDSVSAEAFGNDIDNQSMSNYSYDEIGNLSADIAEGICKIRWFPNGKIKRIVRTNPTRQKADLAFEYDGMGNRVKKTVSFIEDGRSYFRTTFYVRDAQGNVLTTYEERNCQLFAGDDTLGDYYYQFSESYGYYTLNAIEQIGEDAFFNFLLNQFSKKDELKTAAWDNLDRIDEGQLRDSILSYMLVSDYFNLYASAKSRVYQYDQNHYANKLFNDYKSYFIDWVNYKNEVYIEYLIANNGVSGYYQVYDNNFTSYYSQTQQGQNAQYFNSIYKTILQELFGTANSTMIKNLLGLNSTEYNTVIQGYDDPEYAYNELMQLIEQLDQDLAAQDPTNIQYYTRMIRALLLASNLEPYHLEYIMSSIDLANFYNAYSGWLMGGDLDALNSLLYLLHGAHDEFGMDSPIDINNLNPFEPLTSTLDLINYDINGDYLKYFIHLDKASPEVIAPMQSFLNGLSLTSRSLYFNSSSLAYQYVRNALSAHLNKQIFIEVLETDPYTKTALHYTESISQLIHYFGTKHLDQTVWQHYYNDTLNISLSEVPHLNPYAYAKELESVLSDVDFPSLSGCDEDSLYTLASSYNIYGSSRLGTMDAKSEREDDDNIYSRKLGGKQYELSDHLGNVVATVSDKKLHPQELLPPGSHAVDTTIGFQPEVTGRYDYYPFGMEIMSRSGSFTNINYATKVTETIYSGLLKDCADYTPLENENPSYAGNYPVKHCTTEENLYGQDFVSSISFECDHPSSNDRIPFYFSIDLKLSEIIPNFDINGKYQIALTFDNAFTRPMYCESPKAGELSSLSAGEGATLFEIRMKDDKIVTISFTGAEIDSYAVDGILTLKIKADWGLIEYPSYSREVDLTNIRVSQIFEDKQVPMAVRSGSSSLFKDEFNEKVNFEEDFSDVDDWQIALGNGNIPCAHQDVINGEDALVLESENIYCGAKSKVFHLDDGKKYILELDVEKPTSHANNANNHFICRWERYNPVTDDWGQTAMHYDVPDGRTQYTHYHNGGGSGKYRMSIFSPDAGDPNSDVLGYVYSINVREVLGDWSTGSGAVPNAISENGKLRLQNSSSWGGALSREIPVRNKGIKHTISFDAERLNLPDTGNTYYAYVVVRQRNNPSEGWTNLSQYTTYYPTSLTEVVKSFVPTKDYIQVYITSSGNNFPEPMEFYVDNIVITDSISESIYAENVYPYGFNGQERDDEIAGSGNSYTALFWQYSPRRAGRWNLDPKPNPSISPYAVFQGNPIMYTDVLGDTVEYNSFRDRLKVGINSLFNKEFRTDVKELKASEETYVFKGSDQLNGGGNTSTDGDDIYINYSWNSKDRDLGTGRATSLFHETEHGIQFEHGEFGFRKTNNGSWTAVNYDLTDEMGAMRAGSFAPGSILKDYNGNNTFQGDMRSLGTNLSNPTVVQNNTSIILRYYQNQPNATYNKLPQTPLNNTQVKSRLNNGSFFMRPLTPRGR